MAAGYTMEHTWPNSMAAWISILTSVPRQIRCRSGDFVLRLEHRAEFARLGCAFQILRCMLQNRAIHGSQPIVTNIAMGNLSLRSRSIPQGWSAITLRHGNH